MAETKLKPEQASATPRFKVGTFTRDQTLTTSLSITGVGFKPSAVMAMLMPATSNDALYNCVGFDDGSTKYALINKEDVSNYTPYLWYTGDAASWGLYAYISSFDTDGFTLAFGKDGTPPAGTYASYANTSATVPMTWTTSDYFVLTGSYEMA